MPGELLLHLFVKKEKPSETFFQMASSYLTGTVVSAL